MNFGKTDMYILVGSFMVVVFMSLVFPALGLANDSANQSDVPELNIEESTIELVGDRPDFPGSPTGGEIQYQVDIPVESKQAVLKEDGENAVYFETYCDNDDPVNETCYAILNVFDSGGYVDSDNVTINRENFTDNDIVTLTAEDNSSNEWQIRMDYVSVDNWNTTNVEYVLEWKLLNSPDTSGIENVPVIGGIYSTGQALASIIGWGVTTFFWFCTWFVELVINVLGLLVNLILFAINLVGYMISNYNGMLQNVGGFASFILLFPIILLSVELLKLGFIFIKILPTT